MDWIQQWQSKFNKQNGVAPLVRTGGSRHTGLAALPHRNIQKEIQNHLHAAGKDRKNELSEGQSKKHTFRIITDFLIYLDFQS